MDGASTPPAQSDNVPEVAAKDVLLRDDLDAIPLRHPGRWVLAAAIVVVVGLVAVSLYRNPNIDHGTIARYQLSETMLLGVETTVELAVVSQAIGIVIGIILAIARLSGNPVLVAVSWLYIWLLRSVPLLVQILIWGNFGVLFKHIVLGVPYTNLSLVSFVTSNILTVFVASIIALSTSEGAYMAEIVRAGILSVGPGQRQAALALGMTHLQVMRRVVLPQALRVIIPPTGNDFINMLKNTSLVAVIAGGDLLTRAQDISAQNLRTLEMLFVASVWYLVLTSIASFLQSRFEKKMSRGSFADQGGAPRLVGRRSWLRRGVSMVARGGE